MGTCPWSMPRLALPARKAAMTPPQRPRARARVRFPRGTAIAILGTRELTAASLRLAQPPRIHGTMLVHDSTLSDLFRLDDGLAPRASGSALYVVLCGDQPMEPPARHDLSGVDVVTFSRGARGVRRVLKTGGVHLELQLPDRMMSTDHGGLALREGKPLLDGSHSKNGVLIHGVRVRSVALAPGDAFVLGSTAFLFGRAERHLDHVDQLAGDVSHRMSPQSADLETLHDPLRRTFAALARLAPLDVPMLLRGATGTGKEVAARAIHERSGRSGAFVAVNCGAIAPAILEAELFGHRKGAFSGAFSDRLGHLRAADHGTLFLDEIGELPTAAQIALLRALQEREVTPVGDSTPIPVDFRLCAATHRDLAAMVTAGAFREDLYARLLGATLHLPTLRERRCDLGLLIRSLLRRHGASEARFTPLAALALVTRPWLLNIRELERTLVVASALAGPQPIDVAHLPAALPKHTAAAAPPLLNERELVRRQELEQLLDQHDHNLTRVAQQLGKDRTQIYRWVRRFGIARVRRS